MYVGCAPAREAYERALDRWSAGRFDWTEAERAGEDCRAVFAEIVGRTSRGDRDRPGREHGRRDRGGQHADRDARRERRGCRERIHLELLPVAPAPRAWLRGARGAGYRRRRRFGRCLRRSGRWRHPSHRGERRALAHGVPDGPRRPQPGRRPLRSLVLRRCLPGGGRGSPRRGARRRRFPGRRRVTSSCSAQEGMGYLYVRRGLRRPHSSRSPRLEGRPEAAESFYGPAMDLSPTASKLDAFTGLVSPRSPSRPRSASFAGSVSRPCSIATPGSPCACTTPWSRSVRVPAVPPSSTARRSSPCRWTTPKRSWRDCAGQRGGVGPRGQDPAVGAFLQSRGRARSRGRADRARLSGGGASPGNWGRRSTGTRRARGPCRRWRRRGRSGADFVHGLHDLNALPGRQDVVGNGARPQ